MQKIQVSAKIPVYLYNHFLLNHADRTAALIAALEKLYKIETNTAENATIEPENAAKSILDSIDQPSDQYLKYLREQAAENQENRGFQPDFTKVFTTEKKENIFEVDLNTIESAEIKQYLKEYGFEEDRYLTPENEERAKAEFEKVLLSQSMEFNGIRQKYETDLEALKQTQSAGEYSESLEKLKLIVANTKALLKEFEAYSKSFRKRFTYEYSREYLVKTYFAPEYHAVLLLD